MSRMDRPPGFRRGDLIPAVRSGRCYGCHRPWGSVGDRVSVSYRDDSAGVVADFPVVAVGSSQFALCRSCWDVASVEERVEAHTWTCTEWARLGRSPHEVEAILSQIMEAIRADDLDMWLPAAFTD